MLSKTFQIMYGTLLPYSVFKGFEAPPGKRLLALPPTINK